MPPSLVARSIDALVVEDEASFVHVPLYADLKRILRRDRYVFRVLPKSRTPRWDRALCLNLTFWASGGGGDVLVGDHVPADVVAHAAWHHLAARGLASASPHALFLGEAIASAFDLYLVGRLLGRAPRSSFLATQVPAMAEAAQAGGATARAFEAMLEAAARDPDGAFEALRALLYDVTRALYAARTARAGLVALTRFEGRPFAPLLHRYELSNWVLYARAYSRADRDADRRVAALDGALRRAPSAIDRLTQAWVAPRLRPT